MGHEGVTALHNGLYFYREERSAYRIFIRNLRNCSKYLPSNVTTRGVKEYLRRMQYSDYGKEFRTQIVESAMNAFDVMLEKDASGV